jgi:trimeric autotransporter adhesin
LTYTYSRARTQVIPNFAGRTNVSGVAGVTGNLQDSTDWGPPTLSFTDGIYGLTDANSSFNRNATNDTTASVNWYHGKHNVTAIVDFQRKEFNDLAQSNPRGVFNFTAQAPTTSGYDFADFLLGAPTTSNIAYGNADKYFRQSVYAVGATDDWRIRPELTINAGMRWEYGAPMTELKNRLVNLDIAPGFTNETPVVASQPIGPLTGTHYPTSLLRPDKNGFQPRVGISWRPIAGSTLVVKAGYGIYADTSVYNSTSLAMAQQFPLSTSVQIPNVLLTSGLPCETLANGFNSACPTSTIPDSFAVDPNFRVGYAQTWQLLAQRDLPGSLQGTITYLGIKGTRGVQEFLPNSYPLGGTSPCPACPVGYAYRTSGGDSTRESIQGQLRRRLKNGFTASISYTYSKSIDDDAALGGQGPIGAGAISQTTGNVTIAQNWLNLRGERGLSTFDQRNLLSANVQYTSGQGIGGGSLMEGWRGTVLKEWTFVTTITAGSGLPETPVYSAYTPGTTEAGYIRASLTGQPIYKGAGAAHLNQAAFAAPTLGQWGTAGRDSIEGPDQFSLNSSLARTFRLKGRYNLDTRVDATNTLNHVVYSSWVTNWNNSLFGTPTTANGMRSLQITMRLRY